MSKKPYTVPEVGHFGPARPPFPAVPMLEWVMNLPTAAAAGAPAAPETFPWDLTLTEASSTQWHLSVRPGTLNGIVPGNMFTVATIPKDTLYYVFLSVDSSQGQVTTVSLSANTAHPQFPLSTPDVPPGNFKHVIGMVTSDNATHNIAKSNLVATPVQAFVTDKANPGPNELPYRIHYSWEVRRDVLVA